MTVTPSLCPHSLADIQSAASELQNIALDWVGMEQIDLPLEFEGRPVNAKVSAGINLLNVEGATKGIHMSRLYMQLDTLTQSEVTPGGIRDVLHAFIASQQEHCNDAYLDIHGDLFLSRKSLNSNQFGWKGYPISVTARAGQSEMLRLKVGIPYASTCPNSAALSRQVAQLEFRKSFGDRIDRLPLEEVVSWIGEHGLPATPHAQRSWAWIDVELNPESPTFPIRHLIDTCELALGTAVQTVVKRSDEQAFALACGQNLMFCEDAARLLYRCLRQVEGLRAFEIRVEHQESLHAHNAVAKVSWKEQ
ncbi:TPA: GTP cyclohydrolase I FolE2 [Klebsiella variicola]|uniref:GTP cyclohydrolase FolE2 n=1 Tax=Klebsiella variicola TaxID=244366 RepID=UPI0007CC1873|nr:GTP cyclohydrolase FolE2 [Klebsiella variicola]PXJ81700.1 GTP cyclohydrolase I FolE2 [Klebsiella variicola]SBK83316.1 GTP cyclohydrolase I [Klebsiella variicola]HCL6959819.1 GTP cyclohydrolase I FolE2 [Klebsiella variicola]